MKIRLVLAVSAIAITALGASAASNAVFAGTIDDGAFTVTATNGQLNTTKVGAATFADSSTFAGYAGSVTTPGATIAGGLLNPSGSTNPDSGISSSIANYLSTEPTDSATITFNTDQSYFGFLWGSVDPGNTVSLFEGSTLLGTYTGAILNADAAALQYYPAAGSFVDFSADSSSDYFDKIVFSGVDAPFESDNYANSAPSVSAVPEPITLSLFGAGLAGTAAMRRRKKANKA